MTSILWNKLPLAIKQQDNLSKFKYEIKTYMNYKCNAYIPSKFNKPLCNKLARNLLQMRLGLSTLNNHLFTYNISDNPLCPNCFDNVESTCHFFLECRHYAVQRATLLQNVSILYHNL